MQSCGFKEKSQNLSASGSCALPDDQVGTLMGAWPIGPVPIAFKSGDFTPTEQAAIIAAADVWNRYFEGTSRGAPVIDYGSAVSPYQTTLGRPADVCTRRLTSPEGFLGKVVLYKISTGWAYGSQVIALTTLCKDPTSGYPAIYSSISEVNFQDYFVTGKKIPDLTSIYVHEFGHMLGVDHSCDNRSGFPTCNSSPPTYLEAVMFPGISFSGQYGAVRRDLNENDKARAGCVVQ